MTTPDVTTPEVPSPAPPDPVPTPDPVAVPLDPRLDALVDDLAAELTGLAAAGDRVMVGLCGAPGSGKSTLAALLGARLGPDACAVVPMDGFHLATAVIRGTPLADRRGAIDTFDADGFVHLLRRIRARDEDVVYAPEFRRGLEEPIAGAIPVPRAIPIVVTEGNHLLADVRPWEEVPRILDATWFVDTPDDLRMRRLVARHVEHGMDPSRAAAWAAGPDEDSARRIRATAVRADRRIAWG